MFKLGIKHYAAVSLGVATGAVTVSGQLIQSFMTNIAVVVAVFDVAVVVVFSFFFQNISQP